MRLKFWGVRGSIPSPLRPEEIEEKILNALLGAVEVDLSDPAAVREYLSRLPFHRRGTIGGNTPCLEVNAGQTLVVLDAGSGLRPLGLKLMKGKCGRGQGVVHLFLTHLHWDHIQGFPFFAPAYVPGNRIFVYSPHSNVAQLLADQQRAELFPIPLEPVRADIGFVRLEERDSVSLDAIRIHNIPMAHPGGSYGYRLESDQACIVYATDAEYKELAEIDTKKYIDFFTGANVLIFDAQYTLLQSFIEKEDWGHSSSFIGSDMATIAGVKKLILFHHDPTSSDQKVLEILEATKQYYAQDPSNYQCEIVVAHEGLELNFGAQPQ